MLVLKKSTKKRKKQVIAKDVDEADKDKPEPMELGEFEYLREIIEPFPKCVPVCILNYG